MRGKASPVEPLGEFAEEVQPFVQPIQQDCSCPCDSLKDRCPRKTRMAKGANEFPAPAAILVAWNQPQLLLRFKQRHLVVAVRLCNRSLDGGIFERRAADKRESIPAHSCKTQVGRGIAELYARYVVGKAFKMCAYTSVATREDLIVGCRCHGWWSFNHRPTRFHAGEYAHRTNLWTHGCFAPIISTMNGGAGLVPP